MGAAGCVDMPAPIEGALDLRSGATEGVGDGRDTIFTGARLGIMDGAVL